VQCEASGDWHIASGNGFYGGPQFTLGTWRAYGGAGYPQDATPAEQVAVARRVLTTGWRDNPPQGRSAWPVCGPRVNLQPGD
jgi:hypothetical protein